MSARRCLFSSLIFSATAAAAGGDARVGPLDVKQGKTGGPCFTIPEAYERQFGAPQFESISVHAADAPKAPVWTMTMPERRSFRLTYMMCIPYAGRLPVLPKTPADALADGRVYVVTVRTADGARLYRARFCVAGAAPAVRQLPAAASANALCPR